MSLMMNVLIWVLVLLACVALILWAYMTVRARRIAARLGAFRCWSRPDHHAGWTAGIGVYGVEELSWYRLVGMSLKPVYSVPRRGMEVSAPISRSDDGSMVEVRLAYGEHRYEVAVERLTYNGLVSWVESGPPRRP